jgi:endonuclease-3 related protein
MIQNSYDLLCSLKRLGYLHTDRDPLWWPQSGTEEVLFGAILTQQTRWERVEESLENLKHQGICSLEHLSRASVEEIASAIRPSGFYNMKAERLQLLCRNILDEFGDFLQFQKEVDRAWLLAQKGIGMESADSILCYGCAREVFVVDSYTSRILHALGYEFENYMQIQAWMQEGIEANFAKINRLYGKPLPLHMLYARFHGKIVEFSKTYVHGRRVDVTPLLAGSKKAGS